MERGTGWGRGEGKRKGGYYRRGKLTLSGFQLRNNLHEIKKNKKER